MNVSTTIKQNKIVPVIVIDNESEGLQLAETLMASELPIAEVTLRTPGALKAIESMAKSYPDLLIGAGTVLSVDDLKAASDCGAAFAVSPCLNHEVVRLAQKLNMPIYPGITNPTQAWQAMDLGLDVVKFFPAEAAGGAPMVKALGSVFPNLGIMPTGGISANNMNDYLALSNVIAVGGSWIVAKQLIKESNWQEITRLIAAAKA